MSRVLLESYHGERAVILSSGGYQATVLPDIGANLISFKQVEKNYTFLREPTAMEMEAFKQRPLNYGIPVLFPPNRYEDGKFQLNHRTYRFPINEPQTHNYSHGFLFNTPWEVISYGSEKEESFVELSHQVNPHHAVYMHFPHTFTISLRYSLSVTGLKQQVAITNYGEEPMPVMLGFHTAFNVPFVDNGSSEDCLFYLTIGNRWELSNRMLATGAALGLNDIEQQMQTTGVLPSVTRLDNHYRALPQDGHNCAVLADTAESVRFIYDVGLQYKHWMIFNGDAKSGFICPEPQTNMVNAPNLDLPSETSGVILLPPEETWSATSLLYMENVSGD